MQELIDKLKSAVGLTEEQAGKALSTVKEFVTEKFPMLDGMIDSVLGNKNDDNPNNDEGLIGKAGEMFSGLKDKVGGFSEAAGDKLENLGDSAKDMAGDALDKLKGLFGNDK